MDKEQLKIQMMDYLSGSMHEDEMNEFEKVLQDNPALQMEMQALMDTWDRMGNLKTPEPSEAMDATFFDMLSNEMDKQHQKSASKKFPLWLWPFPKAQWVFGLLLLSLGIAVGYFLNSNSEEIPVDNVVVNEETESVRQKLVLTLLEQPSANQRLQGVSEANKFEDADEIVIRALLQTLNQDSNVNVRLAAIESLTNYVDQPVVRQGLVQSIPNQESPILQITLANLMVALQEKASIEPFRQLLQERKLDTTVQKKIKNSIESII
ncbi:HEAT repeat domain-containing protein [Flagellimonas algicola]|uniref:HEAT repeat protein n=1 Tax=Flagellimonas algicola TaxID=2583815 RepID=A0ABY2WHV4_9FLAO|nr:HEAT repeat domain-containing protein [Allomuricauda algicola]TMU54416.1 hypothetical protein FGG15_09335 [Allomuricauda algicola]